MEEHSAKVRQTERLRHCVRRHPPLTSNAGSRAHAKAVLLAKARAIVYGSEHRVISEKRVFLVTDIQEPNSPSGV